MIRSCLPLFAVLSLVTALHAQTPSAPKLEFPAASPACTVKQRVGLTDVEISYARPSARSRKVFGGLVPFGEVWRTGANTATKITFSGPVKLAGADVPAGSYALFTIPDASEWTVILNKVTDQWGAYKYDAANDLVRVKAKPSALAEPLETLDIGFQDLRDTSVTLYVAWEKVRLPVKLEVDVVASLVPRIEAAMAAEGKKPYFPAAMFYFENGLDLKKAATWIDAGVAEQPNAFWMIYRKGLILEKAGDKKGALAAARQSLELASKAEGAIKEEYTRLNEALIARLQ